MLKTKATIEEITKEIVDFLSNYINVDRLVLFGSYNGGNPREDSDFDIAVISEDLERTSIMDKIALFSKVSLMIDSRIELKGFSKKEFLNTEKGSILYEIKKKGRVLYHR